MAYLLEFRGVNTFLAVWLSSVVFHVVNVMCIALIVSSLKQKQMHNARLMNAKEE